MSNIKKHKEKHKQTTRHKKLVKTLKIRKKFINIVAFSFLFKYNKIKGDIKMYEYHLNINLYDENINEYKQIEVSYEAFDKIDAENIAKLLTENLPNFKSYTIFRKDSILISHYKKK